MRIPQFHHRQIAAAGGGSAPTLRALTEKELADLTPRARLDAVHAMQAYLDWQVRRGELVERSEIDAGHAEMRELIRSDLLGTLPLRLAGDLGNRKRTPAAVREAVLVAIREQIRTWAKAGAPMPEGE
jgi:hypothetical protein